MAYVLCLKNFCRCIFVIMVLMISILNLTYAEALKGTALKAGDCIGIVAPGSGIEDMDISAAVRKLQSWGYRVKLAPNLYAQSGYLAGSAKERADDLNMMFADEEVKAILCLRGGYGSALILDLLDYDLIKAHPKMLIGYSDITALHAALQRRADLVSIHAPMVIDINDDSYNYTDAQLQHGLASTSVSDNGVFSVPNNHYIEILHEGIAEGKLIGGNLSVIASLCGTPYALDGTDSILFIEEVREDSYVIDRYMQQLYQSGLLKNIKGMVIGNLRRCEPTTHQPYDYSVREVFQYYADLTGIPVIYNFPVGHGSINGFLPLNVQAMIKAQNGVPQLIIKENYAK